MVSPCTERSVALPNGEGEIALSRLQALYLHENVQCSQPTSDTLTGSSRVHLSPPLTPPQGPQRRIVVTGGAGFVGSHLVDRLMLMGHHVVVVDNFTTGNQNNLLHWLGNPHLEIIHHDVVDPLSLECDQIYHLACPASPPSYQIDAVRTIRTCVLGTLNILEAALRTGARFLLASTSEVYGDPEAHPQAEEYWGHVNPIGVRACYDEGKRCAEALAYSYERQHGLQLRVARIFNTYGPRMGERDGRVVSNFITQALRGDPLTIYGEGQQTRSFQYIHDLVSGLIALMNHQDCSLPVNLGNPEEYPIIQLAYIIRELTGSSSSIVHLDKVPDDPKQRKPDITRAQKLLNWRPSYDLQEGLLETIEYFRRTLLA